jgi:predicted transposase/invertase (TIGR01784 family)
VLQLIVESEPNTLAQGQELIQQVRQQFQESLKRQDILELIETILIYKLPKLNRKEIEKMFSLSDLRETKVYQEALEEGREEGREEGEEKGRKEGKEEKARQIALKMLSDGFPTPEIARFTDLSPDAIEQLQRQQRN